MIDPREMLRLRDMLDTMSMLSEQAKRLRKTADKMRNAARIVDWYPYSANLLRDAARDLCDAADTIDELRARCQEMQEMERQTCVCEGCAMHICKRCGVAYELNIVDKGFGKARYCPNCGYKELYA